MNTFKQYSQYYDLLYQSKDYPGEVAFIVDVINKYHPKAKSILSLGCGTCSHDILLAKKGFSVTAVDQSATMLEIASNKIKKAGLASKIKLVRSDIRKLTVANKHDIAMAMFNVVGYQIKNTDINSVLTHVSQGLKPGGIFVFDCWFMPAVLADKPTDKVREINDHNHKIIRLTQSKLDLNSNTIEINFHVLETTKSTVVSEAEETHFMRYWSLPELDYILSINGFKLAKICNFMDLNQAPDEKHWDIFVIAQKK